MNYFIEKICKICRGWPFVYLTHQCVIIYNWLLMIKCTHKYKSIVNLISNQSLFDRECILIKKSVSIHNVDQICVFQICQREQRLLWHRICSWWTDNWNKFDAVMYIMYLLSVILRFSMKKDDFVWARMAYSVTLAFFILRTLQFFYVAKNTGPKIIMIGKMVGKMYLT